MSKFGNEVRAGIDEMQQELNDTLRAFYIELFTQIIMRSPVGNPRNWKVNASKVAHNDKANAANRRIRTINASRKSYNADSIRWANSRIIAGAMSKREANKFMRSRKLKRVALKKTKKIWRPKGYQGGGFRGAWQFSFDGPIDADIERLDPSGSIATGALVTALEGLDIKAQGKVWFCNNKPYSEAIEFGVAGKSPLYPIWSRQAPRGVVRITLNNAAAVWSKINATG